MGEHDGEAGRGGGYAAAGKDAKDGLAFQPVRPRGPFTQQPPAIKKDCHDKLQDGDFCDINSGACDNKCKNGAWQHFLNKGKGQCCTKQDSPYKCRDRDAHRLCCDGYEEIEQTLYYNQTTVKFVQGGFKNGICMCFKTVTQTPEVVREGYTDTPRDQFEARPYKYEPSPKKPAPANCTKWEVSHVRQVLTKLRTKFNETKPSEWNIMAGQGRINSKDGLRVLLPKPVFEKVKAKNSTTNATDDANATGGNGSLTL